MNYKFLVGGIISLVSLTTIASAVTLTAEMTEKVVVPLAYKTKVCVVSNSSMCKELIFGYAYVYTKNSGSNPASNITIFELDGTIYRGVQGQLIREDSEFVLSESLSKVNTDGTEEKVKAQAFIALTRNSSKEELINQPFIPENIGGLVSLTFTLDNLKYELSSVIDKSSFTWYPGTGIVE